MIPRVGQLYGLLGGTHSITGANALEIVVPYSGEYGHSRLFRTDFAVSYASSSALRSDVEAWLNVYKTGGRNHYTIELPKPVTREAADLFNGLFGRSAP